MLRSLTLGEWLSAETKNLLWMAQDASFPSLRQLRVSVVGEFERWELDHFVERSWPETPYPTRHHAMMAFLDRLPPLEEINLGGSPDPSLVEHMVIRHGPTLWKLEDRFGHVGPTDLGLSGDEQWSTSWEHEDSFVVPSLRPPARKTGLTSTFPSATATSATLWP